MRAWSVRITALAAVLASSACAEAPPTAAVAANADGAPANVIAPSTLPEWLASYLGGSSSGSAEILVGAGDIAECYQGTTPPPLNPTVDPVGSAAAKTAALLAQIPGTIMAIGDNAYQFGTMLDYRACYEPTWGHRFDNQRPQFYDRTQPAAGNHEYMTPGAAGFFEYFFERPKVAPTGYYSYNQGSWHVIVLNSTPQVYMCYPPELTEVQRDPSWNPPQLNAMPQSESVGRKCAGDVAQQAWLVADLRAHSNYQCTAVYFHHPRYSSGRHGNHYQMQRIWDILYVHGVDVVIAAHDHNYERFAPQDLKSKYDPQYGIRQFVVGTGGADLRTVGAPIANSEVIVAGAHGVLALGLNDGSYNWAFVTVQPDDPATTVNERVRDHGAGSCHGAPPEWRLKYPLPT